MKLLNLFILVCTVLTSSQSLTMQPAQQPPRGPVARHTIPPQGPRPSFLSTALGMAAPSPVSLQTTLPQVFTTPVQETLEAFPPLKPTGKLVSGDESDGGRKSRSPEHGRRTHKATKPAKKTSVAAAVYQSDSEDYGAYLSDSDKPTVFDGTLPDITSVQSHYKPSSIDLNWWFKGTLLKLRKGEAVDPRDIEKAAAEALNYRHKYDAREIAEFSTLVEARKIPINPAYWGDLHQAGDLNKIKKAKAIIDFLEENITDIQSIHDGMIATVKGYGRLNGKAIASPRTDYGLGSRYTDSKVTAYQQAIAKIFEIAAFSPTIGTSPVTAAAASKDAKEGLEE